MREVFKQKQYEPLAVEEQITVLLALNEGLFDDLPLEQLAEAQKLISEMVKRELPEICQQIQQGEKLSEGDRQKLLTVSQNSLSS